MPKTNSTRPIVSIGYNTDGHVTTAYTSQPLSEGKCNLIIIGVKPAGDAGDTSPQYFGWGTSTGISPPPILLRTFGYSGPILVALRSLSLKPISFGYKTPPIRFSQAGGQSAHKARPPPEP